jgi:predicted RNA-binding protein with RPS1 domain
VSGVVLEHQPYGLFVDLGEGEPGVVIITMINDDSSVANPPFPPVGSRIEMAFLGYSGPGKQPRLSPRPSDLEKARHT